MENSIKINFKMKSRSSRELHELSAALKTAHVAQESAAKARARATKAVAEANRSIEAAILKGEALQESLKTDRLHDNALIKHAVFDELEWSIHSDGADRRLLIMALGMLASENAIERAAAALIVETQRAEIDLDWEDLISWNHPGEF